MKKNKKKKKMLMHNKNQFLRVKTTGNEHNTITTQNVIQKKFDFNKIRKKQQINIKIYCSINNIVLVVVFFKLLLSQFENY